MYYIKYFVCECMVYLFVYPRAVYKYMLVYDVPSQCRVLFYINYILDAIMCVSWLSSVALGENNPKLYTLQSTRWSILFYFYTCKRACCMVCPSQDETRQIY